MAGTPLYSGVGLPIIDGDPPVLKTDNALVSDGVCNILLTRPEEPLLEDIGSRLEEIVFEPNDFVLQKFAQLFVVEALINFEPRINVGTVQYQITNSSQALTIALAYTIIGLGPNSQGLITLPKST